MKDAPTDAPNTADADTAPVAEDTAAATLEEPAPADDGTAEETPETAEEATPAKGEAARYRRRLRDEEAAHGQTKAELDTLAGRVAVMQRAEVERIAGGLLADGADFWRDGAELAAVLDADGNVDTAAVTELAAAAAKSHPHWARAARKQPPRGGLASGATNPGDRTVPSWQHVLRTASR